MLDIKFVRENPEIVKENIKKKFQDAKLSLVDKVIELDQQSRAAITEASELRSKRNALSKANGPLFGKLKKAEGDEKAAIQAQIDANMAPSRPMMSVWLSLSRWRATCRPSCAPS